MRLFIKNTLTTPKGIINCLFSLYSIIISIVIIFQINFNFSINIVFYESISLAVSVTVSISFNVYFVYVSIREPRNVSIRNSKVNIHEVKQINLSVNDNPDVKVIDFLINCMSDFEYAYCNGDFNLNGLFSLDLLEKLDYLRRSIPIAKYKCMDNELNTKIRELKKYLDEFSATIICHSWPVSSTGMARMGWSYIQKDGTIANSHHTVSPKKIDEEKAAYYKACRLVDKVLEQYYTIIEYWRRTILNNKN